MYRQWGCWVRRGGGLPKPFFGHTYATVSVLAPIPVVAALLYCVELPTALMTPQQECYYVEPSLTLGGFFPPSVAT